MSENQKFNILLTKESSPKVSNIKKKIMAHKCGYGNVLDIASGYAINANPGPAKQIILTLRFLKEINLHR